MEVTRAGQQKRSTGDTMLPTHPWVKMDELRVSGCSMVPRFLEGITRATKYRLRNSSGKL